MALNEVFKPGDRLPVPVPAGVVSGNPVVVGSLIGVAQISRDAAGYVTIDTAGVYEFTVTGAINFGDPVYAVTSGGLVTSLTATASGNTRFGTSMTTQAATGKCRVKLVQP